MEVQDQFKEFPPAPEILTPDIDWFTPSQHEVGVNTGIIINEVFHGFRKVVPHLDDYENSRIHYRRLTHLVKLGAHVSNKSGAIVKTIF